MATAPSIDDVCQREGNLRRSWPSGWDLWHLLHTADRWYILRNAERLAERTTTVELLDAVFVSRSFLVGKTMVQAS